LRRKGRGGNPSRILRSANREKRKDKRPGVTGEERGRLFLIRKEERQSLVSFSAQISGPPIGVGRRGKLVSAEKGKKGGGRRSLSSLGVGLRCSTFSRHKPEGRKGREVAKGREGRKK